MSATDRLLLATPPAEGARDRAVSLDRTRDRQRAFEETMLIHRERLVRLALKLCRNRTDAEDLVQETFLRAFRGFERFTPGTNGPA